MSQKARCLGLLLTISVLLGTASAVPVRAWDGMKIPNYVRQGLAPWTKIPTLKDRSMNLGTALDYEKRDPGRIFSVPSLSNDVGWSNDYLNPEQFGYPTYRKRDPYGNLNWEGLDLGSDMMFS